MAADWNSISNLDWGQVVISITLYITCLVGMVVELLLSIGPLPTATILAMMSRVCVDTVFNAFVRCFPSPSTLLIHCFTSSKNVFVQKRIVAMNVVELHNYTEG